MLKKEDLNDTFLDIVDGALDLLLKYGYKIATKQQFDSEIISITDNRLFFYQKSRKTSPFRAGI